MRETISHRIIATIAIIFFLSFSIYAQSQSEKKKITTYYSDKEGKALKEVYYVLESNPQIIEGEYISYYQSGEVKSKGHYINNKPKGSWYYYYEDGTIKTKGEIISSEKGYWTNYYENEHTKSEGLLLDGKKSGEWRYYYESGKLKSTGIYQKGNKHGVWKYYNENGKLKGSTTYTDGEGKYKEYYPNNTVKMTGEIKNNKSNGLWKYFYENGKLQAEGQEKEGLKNGMWKFYYPDGTLSSEGSYENGVLVGKWKYYHDNGNLSSEGIHLNGDRDGEWNLYYPNGTLKGEGNFDEGTGKYKEYYQNGNLKLSGAYKDDEATGEWIYYYPDGTKEGEATFRQGIGMYKGYYKNGSLKMEGTIRNGKKEGIWTLYKENGEVAGHYNIFYKNAEEPIFLSTTNNSDSLNIDTVRADTIKPTVSRLPPYYGPKRKKEKSRYFKPIFHEKRGFILSMNPLASVWGNLPVSLEYHYQERLGYELTYFFLRRPFFQLDEDVDPNKIYDRGFAIDVRMKLYEPKEPWGMLYLGHELRYSFYNHMVNLEKEEFPPMEHPDKIEAASNFIEYVFLFGNRFIGETNESGLTADVHIGLGIGYRDFRTNYDTDVDRYNELFSDLNQGKISVPLRFFFNLGYYF